VSQPGSDDIVVAIITLGVWTLHRPDKNAPATMCFFLAAVLLLAAAGDIGMLARGGISGTVPVFF
jgi:hypothetical protein